MNIAVQIEPESGAPADVLYRWDPDTDILTASFKNGAGGQGMSGSVELAGADGSWVILDVAGGYIRGVEVAVWPDVRKVSSLTPPANVQPARVVVPARSSDPGVAAIEVDTLLLAEADQSEKTIHFKVGSKRAVKTLRIARDVLLETDERGIIVGLWMLNVPPFPADA